MCRAVLCDHSMLQLFARYQQRSVVSSAGGPPAVGRQHQQPPRRRRPSAVDAVRERLEALDWNKIFKVSFMLLFVAYPGKDEFASLRSHGEYCVILTASLRVWCRCRGGTKDYATIPLQLHRRPVLASGRHAAAVL